MWLSLLALGGTHINLPLPKFCVHTLHRKLVEPFLHQGLQLVAVAFKRGTPYSLAQPLVRILPKEMP